MTTHVFIVDETTFKTHLEYMFAGTGAKDRESPFLIKASSDCHHSTERNLVGMISDISRIRPGDNIIFYLQATGNSQGMFFGVFKAETTGFFDENDNGNYLLNDLGKGLSFRIRISPNGVYPLGITEHEYLDDITDKTAPFELCWSMIYRKLKGNRGCTMLTQYEFDDLLQKLKRKNSDGILPSNYYSFDKTNSKIINIDEPHQYNGRRESLDIKARLIHKANSKKSFETHLQAFIMQKYDDIILKSKLLMIDNKSAWIGNEVSCGVGMQRIDIMIIESDNKEIHVKIIELKDEEPYDYIIDEQLPWYIKWSLQYLVPNLQKYNKSIIIHPCIIAQNTSNRTMIDKIKNKELISLNIPNIEIKSTEYIGFSIRENDINFEKIL